MRGDSLPHLVRPFGDLGFIVDYLRKCCIGHVLHSHGVCSVDIFLVRDKIGYRRRTVEAVFSGHPVEIRNRVKIAVCPCASYYTLTSGFFKYDLSVFAEKANYVGRLLGVGVIKFVFSHNSRLRDRVFIGNYLFDILVADPCLFRFASKHGHGSTPRENNIFLRLYIRGIYVGNENIYVVDDLCNDIALKGLRTFYGWIPIAV